VSAEYERQHAKAPPQHQLRQSRLKPGAKVGASESAYSHADTERPFGCHVPAGSEADQRVRGYPANEVRKVAASAAGATSKIEKPRPTKIGPRIEPPPIP
jgi:hypothetical protein